MTKALFYKEWIKTRKSVLLMAGLLVAFLIYTFINTAQDFRASGATQIWNSVITKDVSLLPSLMQWIPVVFGLMLAVWQVGPEMTDKRLKLTLHLPMQEDRIISAILAYGLVVLVSLFVFAYAVLIAGMSAYFPSEIIYMMVWKTLPWFMAGLCAYLLTVWVCLEPIWKQKIFNGAAASAMCYFLLINSASGAYKPFIPVIIVFSIVCFSFPFFSAARFKAGVQ